MHQCASSDAELNTSTGVTVGCCFCSIPVFGGAGGMGVCGFISCTGGIGGGWGGGVVVGGGETSSFGDAGGC